MIASRALRQSAGDPDARCFLNIAGVCQDGAEAKTRGCVLCHVRIPGVAGGAQKPDDICATFGCTDCHAAFDSNGVKGLVKCSTDWWFYAARGMVRTQSWWVEHGYLTIKGMK